MPQWLYPTLGIAYSWYLVFKYPSENFWRRRMSEQYVSIEEGLRRHSINSIALSDDENASRSNTMTSESAVQHHQPRSSRYGHGRKPRRSRKSSASSRKKSTSALHDAARSYALRQQQRQEVNSIKQWFIDRFYFPDPTQVPPASESNSSELRNLELSN
ncbi:hypothetical protein H4R22_001403 [Coemansia sp. RSA 1290]|nr:hypothetical protein H4R22_001403 [Coemansia sp. RSA 1290]